MNDSVLLILSCLAGLILGGFYFGGLWLTIRQLPASKHPAGLLLTSFVIRTTAILGGFYVVMGTSWQRALACLVGFIMMRMLLASRLQPVHPDPPGRKGTMTS